MCSSSFDDECYRRELSTIAFRVLEVPDADVLVPVGGGDIVSGIAAAAKLKNLALNYWCRTRRRG